MNSRQIHDTTYDRLATNLRQTCDKLATQIATQTRWRENDE